jgi:O-antigen ligase
MRAIRELPLAASLLLVGLALFFGGGPESGSLPWLGGGALLAVVVLIASRGVPSGWPLLVPLAALAAWLALSISWSALPDRSWDYANRTLVYLLFALLGLWLAGRSRGLALGLMALFGAVLAWSLLGKVLPVVYDYGPPEVGRLRGPVGLWNQLALVAAFALPLALWRRRLEGALLAYAALVALLLTYSRGGVITAVVVVAAWFVLDEERLESARTLLAAAVPAAVVVGIAFALPGVTGDGQSSHVRWRDGLVFGALLILGAIAANLLRRVPLPRVPGRALIAIGVAVIAVLVVVAVVKGGGSGGALGNGGSRLTDTSSNFRFTWWQQAVHGWEHAKLRGTGAGTFHITNLRYRASYLDYTTEPHNLPLQFLTEAGIVGLALFLLAAAALLHGTHRRRKHELALALVLPAYLVHSLVDIDWDFIAVAAPAFLAAGVLAGGVPVRRVSPFGSLIAAGAALLAFVVLLLPWLGERWSAQATVAPPARAVTLAKRARSVDPLLVEPLWALAFAAELRGDLRAAYAYYEEATRKQPKNADTWLLAGQFAYAHDCMRAAYDNLEKFTELDNKARPSRGGDAYNKALKIVDAGKAKC